MVAGEGTIAGEGIGTAGVFFATPFFFFVPAIKGNGGEDATGEAGGVGSECLEEGSDQFEHPIKTMQTRRIFF